MEALPAEIAAVAAALRRPPRALAAEFSRALADDLPLVKRDGGFVRAAYEPALDEARALLTRRIEAQEERLAALRAQAPPGLPRIFLIEDEYRVVLLGAEIAVY